MKEGLANVSCAVGDLRFLLDDDSEGTRFIHVLAIGELRICEQPCDRLQSGVSAGFDVATNPTQQQPALHTARIQY